MKGLKNYKLKLTALSPIHIGTGEVYEPTNFVIDGGFLYEFDEVLFYKSLDKSNRSQFMSIVSTGRDSDLFEKLHFLILKNKDIVKKIAKNIIPIEKEIERYYKNNIAKPVQLEGKNKKKIFNKFEIERTQRQLNNVVPYITGSSLKGSISTALQEFLYKKLPKHKWNKIFNTTEHTLKNIVISDSLSVQSNTKIGYVINKERFEDDESEMSKFMEINEKNSIFLNTLSFKKLKNDNNDDLYNFSKNDIIESCNNHYLPILKSMTKEMDYLSLNSDFKELINNLKLKENQFLIRVGKHSGARAVTIDGLRKVKVKLCQIKNKKNEGNDSDKRIDRLYKKSRFENEYTKELVVDKKSINYDQEKDYETSYNFLNNPKEIERLVNKKNKLTINAILREETTTWLYGEKKQSLNLIPLGWVLCEFIEDDEFYRLNKKFKQEEKRIVNKMNEFVLSQQMIKNREKLQEQASLKKEQELKEQQEKERIQKEEARKQMSPVELIFDKYNSDIVNIINAMKNNEIEYFDEVKLELAKKIKDILIKKDKTWKKAKQKALKRKEYIESILDN